MRQSSLLAFASAWTLGLAAPATTYDRTATNLSPRYAHGRCYFHAVIERICLTVDLPNYPKVPYEQTTLNLDKGILDQNGQLIYGTLTRVPFLMKDATSNWRQMDLALGPGGKHLSGPWVGGNGWMEWHYDGCFFKEPDKAGIGQTWPNCNGQCNRGEWTHGPEPCTKPDGPIGAKTVSLRQPFEIED